MMNFIGLGLLFISILFTGKQIGDYFQLRKELGGLILRLAPSKAQRTFLLAAGAVFLILLALVTYNYISRDIPLNATYSMLVAIVIISTGRFIGSMVELREEGILGKLKVIQYSEIKSYDYGEIGKRQVVKFQLKTNIEFTSLITKSDIEALELALKKLR